MADEKYLKSGAVARLLGITTTTLASWERRGILVPDLKLPSGHRLYYKKTINDFLSNMIDKVK